MEHVPPTEQEVAVDTFAEMLRATLSDGGRKRAAGLKPPWWKDPVHEPAIFSHLHKWKRGEKHDPDSGVHPLVHLACRALMIAYQETYGLVDPARQSAKLTPESSCTHIGGDRTKSGNGNGHAEPLSMEHGQAVAVD